MGIVTIIFIYGNPQAEYAAVSLADSHRSA